MWLENVRGASLSFLTAMGYVLTTLLLWLPGWVLTRKISIDWLRIVLRAGVIAVAFAPGVFMGPGGEVSIVPALLGTLGSAVMYSVSNLPFGFYVYHGLISILVIWFIGASVGVLNWTVEQTTTVSR
jgi:hypothetical protein